MTTPSISLPICSSLTRKSLNCLACAYLVTVRSRSLMVAALLRGSDQSRDRQGAVSAKLWIECITEPSRGKPHRKRVSPSYDHGSYEAGARIDDRVRGNLRGGDGEW